MEVIITNYSPTVRRRRLSLKLAELRQRAGLTATEAAKRLEWDPAKVARMERNQWKRPDLHDIRLLCDLYGATEDEREALLKLARESRQRGWWADYSDVFGSAYPEFEAGASFVRTYQALLVPGLLQTPAYTAAVLRGGDVLDEAGVERRVQARQTRQEILDREDPPTLVAVIDEAALLRMVGGPQVMREQIRHLIEMAARENITIQVLALDTGAHPAQTTGGFVILDFPEDPSLVYLETCTDNLWLERQPEIQHYTLVFSKLQTLALSPDASVQHMAIIADRIDT